MSTITRRGLSRRSLLTATGAAAIGLTFTACGEKPKAAGANGEEPKLNFYNWDTYIGETTLGDFKKATGVDVNMSLFATNDELFAKLKAGNPGFDVVVPSNEFVTRMSQAGMLEPLDHAKIPNIKNIDPSFLNPDFDPGRKYSMPYTWLLLGIGYRKSKVQGVPDSWKWLFDSDKYKGRERRPGSAVGQVPGPQRQQHSGRHAAQDRADADQAEAVREGLPRRQRPGPAGLGRGRPGAGI